jgi:hypothetical protein
MKVWLSLIIGMCCSAAVWAQELGEARVPVEDRSTEVRAEALSAGLDQVLVRLTGSRDLASLAMLDGVRSQPSRWTQRYSYEQQDEQLLLLARFDSRALLAALEKAGAPVWGTTRPQTLTWLVIQRPGMGELVGASSTDPVAESLRQAAVARGLPLRLPEMDDTDNGLISVADIRGHFDQVLFRASERYDTSLRLAAVLYTGTEPQVRWRLYRDRELLEQGEYAAVDEADAMVRLVDQVTDRLSALYVVRGGTAETLALEVRQVARLEDWSGLQRYLQSLSGVTEVRLEQMAGDQLRFLVGFSGSVEQLRRLLALNRHLQPCEVPLAASVTINTANTAALDVPVPALPAYCWRS